MRDLETLKSVPITTLTDDEIVFLQESDPEWWNTPREQEAGSGTVWLMATIRNGVVTIFDETYQVDQELIEKTAQPASFMCLALVETESNVIRDLRGPYLEIS